MLQGRHLVTMKLDCLTNMQYMYNQFYRPVSPSCFLWILISFGLIKTHILCLGVGQYLEGFFFSYFYFERGVE